MLDWIFGKKEDKKAEKKQQQLDKDEKWMYDYVKQYLTSPIWKNPLLDFIEENCHVFQATQENKFEYTKIFQEFTGLTALLLESMIEEVGISEKTLEKCIIRGMKSERDYKIFQQILLCDNFEAFKKIMVSKNKELQIQALTKIQQSSKGNTAVEKQIEIDSKELERLQLEKAIAMSMAIEDKSASQQEKQLQEAIRQSQLEYQKEEEKRAGQKKEQEKPEKKKTTKLGPLPPIGSSQPPRPITQYKQEETKLKEEIQELKKQEEKRKQEAKEETENQEVRKKRLLEQRELIRKKKQDERKEELNTFMQNKGSAENKPNEEEMERRRNLMKRLKEQLKE